MKYCIYCGAKLPQAAPPVVQPPQPGLPPAQPPTVPPPAQPPARVARPPFPVKVKDEIVSIMSGITALYEREVSLLGLFQSEQVSERVFLKLYHEYSGKLKDFLKARVSKIEDLKGKLDERNERLNEIAMKLEELEVRRKVKEIDASLFSQRAENLRAEERELLDSAKTLRTNINNLEKMLADKRPSEIRDLEANLKTYQSAFKKLIDEGKIAEETLKKIKPDIQETLKFFDSLIRDLKEKDKNLREQLETLQTRYKLSELSIEEYEKRKGELQEELDKIWA
ncbi:MAG: hypothetical protein NWF14_02220 [Candidatus Bathyarchaeota archaeon]|nr:hypothetical protein [Candidatus Bathyarchaeota archaeon]